MSGTSFFAKTRQAVGMVKDSYAETSVFNKGGDELKPPPSVPQFDVGNQPIQTNSEKSVKQSKFNFKNNTFKQSTPIIDGVPAFMAGAAGVTANRNKQNTTTPTTGLLAGATGVTANQNEQQNTTTPTTGLLAGAAGAQVPVRKRTLNIPNKEQLLRQYCKDVLGFYDAEDSSIPLDYILSDELFGGVGVKRYEARGFDKLDATLLSTGLAKEEQAV